MSSAAYGDFTPWLGVFETLRVIGGEPLFMAEHRAELDRAMEVLGLSTNFDFERAREELLPLSGRWRWIVKPGETCTIFSEEPPFLPEPVAISVSPVRVGSGNWDARFKTLSNLSHTQASKLAQTPEVILLNEHGHVACTSRGNIFWRHGETIFTPAHEAGCRCGTVRGFVLNQKKIEIGHFSPSHVLASDEIFVTNCIRGIISIHEIEGKPVRSFVSAAELRYAYAEAAEAQLNR